MPSNDGTSLRVLALVLALCGLVLIVGAARMLAEANSTTGAAWGVGAVGSLGTSWLLYRNSRRT